MKKLIALASCVALIFVLLFINSNISTIPDKSNIYDSTYITKVHDSTDNNLKDNNQVNKNHPRYYDVVVYGGTPSGIMAAIAAKREGLNVALIEPSSHIGGMITGGLSFTDYKNTSIIGGLARKFFKNIGQYYNTDLSFTFEPHVAERILIDMVKEAGIDMYYNNFLNENDGVTKFNGKIISIKTQTENVFYGKVFIDCTYEGDLMAMSGVAYTVGREGANYYNESLAGIRTQTEALNFIYPLKAYDKNGQLFHEISQEFVGIDGECDKKIQAYTYRLCLTDNPKNQKPFSKPRNYNPNRYKLLATWLHTIKKNESNRYLSLTDVIFLGNLPNNKYDLNNSGPFSTDYVSGSLEYSESNYTKRQQIRNMHKEYIQGLIYFLSNDESVPYEIRQELNKWGYAADEFVDNNNWPFSLYIREGRRMVGDFIMTQHDLEGGNKKFDSIGMGSYNIDCHVVQRYLDSEGYVHNEGVIQVPVEPYQIPYRVMMPKSSEVTNLIVPVCISASHIAYSSIRMEPQYMILGEAAGIAAAISIEKNSSVQSVNTFTLKFKLLKNGAVLKLSKFPHIF